MADPLTLKEIEEALRCGHGDPSIKGDDGRCSTCQRVLARAVQEVIGTHEEDRWLCLKCGEDHFVKPTECGYTNREGGYYCGGREFVRLIAFPWR